MSEDSDPTPESPPDEAPPWRAELGDLRSSVETFKAALQQKDTELAYLRGQVEASRKVDAPPVEDGDVEEAVFLKAVDEGDTNALVAAIRKQVDVGVKRELRNLRTNELDPLRARFETVGLPILSDHTRTLAASKMPYLAVKEVAATMETHLQNMTPEQKANEQALMVAYKLSMGEHPDEVYEYRRKAGEREALANLSDGGGRITPMRGQRNLREKYVPSPEDLGGQDAQRAADQKGGKDALAIKMGYDDWSDYMEKTGMVEGAGA